MRVDRFTLLAVTARVSLFGRCPGLRGVTLFLFSTEEHREVNEAVAFDRARRLAASALGDIEFESLQAEGRSLRYEDIETIAFGTADTIEPT